MDHDDDVEHLFSWLQTPELRYREFAGAREITDTVVTWQARTDTAAIPARPTAGVTLEAEPNQRPFAGSTTPETAFQEPVGVASTSAPPAEPTSSSASGGPFALGAAGRGTPRRPTIEEPVVPVHTTVEAPAQRQVAAAAPVPPAPPEALAPPPVAAGGGLLGGAYREEGANGHGAEPAVGSQSSAEKPGRSESSLDAVFGRLAARKLPDPRDRLRRVPGVGPPQGRPR